VIIHHPPKDLGLLGSLESQQRQYSSLASQQKWLRISRALTVAAAASLLPGLYFGTISHTSPRASCPGTRAPPLHHVTSEQRDEQTKTASPALVGQGHSDGNHPRSRRKHPGTLIIRTHPDEPVPAHELHGHVPVVLYPDLIEEAPSPRGGGLDHGVRYGHRGAHHAAHHIQARAAVSARVGSTPGGRGTGTGG
jgi:hypothetical protein